METVVALEDISEAELLPKHRVACKICLRVINIEGEELFNPILSHHKDFVIDPTDKAKVVTCRFCLNPALRLPPKDVVSMYHNRRKLRIRRK
jgi:hypothetical protein